MRREKALGFSGGQSVKSADCRDYSANAAPNQKMNTPTEQIGAYQRSVFRRKQPMMPITIPASANRPPQR